MTDEEIRKVIARHHTGNAESLLAQRMFRVAREVSDITEQQAADFDFEAAMNNAFRINSLERELAICKGEEPPPLEAWA